MSDKPGRFINYALLVGFCVFAATLGISVSISEIGLGIALLSLITGLLRSSIDKKSLSPGLRASLLLPWLIYLGAGYLSSLMGIGPARSFFATTAMPSDLIKALAFCFLLILLPLVKFEKLTHAYVSGALAAALCGIGQVIHSHFWLMKPFGDERARCTLNAVTYGEIISIALALTISKFVSGKNKSGVSGNFIILILLATALMLSQTRGAYLGMMITVLCFLLIHPSGWKKLATVALVMAVILGALGFKNKSIAARMSLTVADKPQTSAKAPESGQGGHLDAASSARLTQWKVGLRIFQDYPVFGVGPANVRKIFDYYYPGSIDEQHGWGNVHNLYLQQAVERGIIGLGALLFLFFSMFRAAWKWFMLDKNEYTLWCVCALPGFFVMNLTETTFQHALPAFSIFLMMALAQASVATNSKSQIPSPKS